MDRIVQVIEEMNPDIIALQEVGDLGDETNGRKQFQRLARLKGLHFVAGPTGPGYYGNAILSRFPLQNHGRTILNYRNREPRGMLHCELDCSLLPGSMARNFRIQVYATHLGLGYRERWQQILRLVARIKQLRKAASSHAFLLGDLNIWWPFSTQLRYIRNNLHGQWISSPTFPARFPFISLDRILFLGPLAGHRQLRHSSGLARIASDHLPLIADVELQ